jgi:predicted GIY-YIG superfamily endonuclease
MSREYELKQLRREEKAALAERDGADDVSDGGT